MFILLLLLLLFLLLVLLLLLLFVLLLSFSFFVTREGMLFLASICLGVGTHLVNPQPQSGIASTLMNPGADKEVERHSN